MSNILIIGAQNRFRTALMERLKREGHRMYILSPGKESVLHKDVKIYRHPYIHPSNREVYFSSRPDIVIFMGAYDSHYDWSPKVAQKTTQQFTADLNNLLFQANEAGVRQFIYPPRSYLTKAPFPHSRRTRFPHPTPPRVLPCCLAKRS